MKNPIDDIALNEFQRLANWIQEWIGFTCFRLAKMFGLFCLSFYTVFFVLHQKHNTNLKDALFVWGTAFVMVLLFLLIFFAEKYCIRHPNRKNFMENEFQVSRTLSLFAGLVLGITIFFPKLAQVSFWSWFAQNMTFVEFSFIRFAEVSFCAFIYFGSCTPRPSKPSKIKELFKRKSVVPATETS